MLRYRSLLIDRLWDGSRLINVTDSVVSVSSRSCRKCPGPHSAPPARFFSEQSNGTFDITAYGAQGGGSNAAAGGKGAEIGGTFSLTAGEKLEIIVGGQGGSAIFNNACRNKSAGGGGGGGALENQAAAVAPLMAPRAHKH